jgi:hypothetical protein
MNMDADKWMSERRDFLKMAAAGAAGALLLPGCSESNSEPAAVPRTTSIIGLVDVAQALADNSLDNNLFWVDNNTSLGSLYQGTSHLRTAIRKGELVQWVVSSLQVETEVNIARIGGAAAQIANPVPTPVALGITFWIGRIAANAGGIYQYDMALKVESRVLTLSTPLTLDVL